MRKHWTLAVAVLVCSLTGCTLEDASERGDQCPNDPQSSEKLSYIVKTDGTICQNCSDHEESFTNGVCPAKYAGCYRDSNKELYCMAKCPSDQLACDGKCADPNSNEHCGAKGDCNDADPNSGNYKGSVCNKDQKCENGFCIIVNCDDKHAQCDGNCIDPMTNNNHCGAKGLCTSTEPSDSNFMGKICNDYSSCQNGDCVCNANYVECDGVCINPETDNSHCGAKLGSCSSDDENDDNFKGFACAGNEKCISKKCLLDKCDEGKELCINASNERSCINLSTDINNCGECNNECKAPEGQVVAGCEDGNCIFACDTENGYIECQEDGQLKCILEESMKTDKQNCGSCGNQCKEEQSCILGECIDKDYDNTSCKDSETGKYSNSKTGCGILCKDCTTIEKIASEDSVICTDEGKCEVVECQAGYHLTDNKGTCVINSALECAAPNQSKTEDCTKMSEHGTGDCTNGMCTIASCINGYHKSEDGLKCDQNTDAFCGEDGDCTKKYKNGTGKCDANKCVLVNCNPNYHTENNACVADNPTHCGPDSKNCEVQYPGGNVSCQSASCKLDSCKTNYHPHNGGCEADSKTDCGAHGNGCKGNSYCSKGSCFVAPEKCTVHENGIICSDNKTVCRNKVTDTPSEQGGGNTSIFHCYPIDELDQNCFWNMVIINCKSYKEILTGKCFFDPSRADEPSRGWSCECKTPGLHFGYNTTTQERDCH